MPSETKPDDRAYLRQTPSFAGCDKSHATGMRYLALCGLAALFTLLVGCNDARVPPTPRGEALQDKDPREVLIVKVWDQGTDRLGGDNGDPHISHYIEVDVLSGKGKGKPLTLPYDEWNVGKAPPAVGATLVMSPMDWVRRDPNSQGRPYNGW